MDKNAWRTFAAVLGALVVFGMLVLAYQGISGPSAEECFEQEMANAISQDSGLSGMDIDEDC